ncbi:MAG: ABC transporter permease [Eubacteriaceae bacterium]|nr:ABC transporter permease [Eubacteriaceae bacterium]
MKTALLQAIELIASRNGQLMNIISVTLRMSIASSLAALLLGVPMGALLSRGKGIPRKVLIVINRTLMGLPPVVCGLICYILFSGVGPLRHLKLLFTVKGMIIAQVMLITPLVIGNTETYLNGRTDGIDETAKGLGLAAGRRFLLTLNECRYQIVSTYLFGFSRAIAEVGAVSMVGGAIAFKTNVMTTAIMMYTNMGNVTLGLALGIILLCMALVLNVTVYILQAVVDR